LGTPSLNHQKTMHTPHIAAFNGLSWNCWIKAIQRRNQY
jgi:hypothetical protein